MRRVLALLIVVFAAFTGYVQYDSARQAQINQMQHAAQSIGQPFTIPTTEALADPALVQRALVETAKINQANVFRTQVGYDAADAPITIQYSLTTQPTKLFNAFPLLSGVYLTPAQTVSSDRYLSTIRSSSRAQIGVIRLLGGGQRIEVRSFSALFQALPTAGIYYVELLGGTTYEQFIASLNNNLHVDSKGAVASNPKTYFTDQVPLRNNESHGRTLLLEIISFALVISIALLLVYRQLRDAKRAAVMSLHGLGQGEVWYRLTGRLVLLTLGTSSFAVICSAMFVSGWTAAFLIGVAERLAFSLLALLFCSFTISMVAARASMSTALKNRKNTGSVFVVNNLVKFAVALFVIVFGAQLARDAASAVAARSVLGDWRSTDKYGIFYPTNVGNDEAEYAAGLPGPAATEALKLYPLLAQQGALYVDASQYEDVALAQSLAPGLYRSLTVNLNFLKQYPIMNDSGSPVAVGEQATDWVVLVPDSYRGQAQAIEHYFQTSRTGSQTFQSVADAEKLTFGDTVSPAIRRQSVKIVWTRSHQKVFSFDANVSRRDGNRITDPIVQVMTSANSTGIDRANSVTGEPGTALKVRLLPAGAHATLQSLSGELKAMKLDDNLRYLVTMDDYVAAQVSFLDARINRDALIVICFLIVLALLAAQGIAVVFDRYGRRVVVRRLHGLGMAERYQEFFRLMLITWLLEGAVGIGLVVVGAGQAATMPGATTAGRNLGYGLAVLAVVCLLELGVSGVALLRVERRRIVTTLKEEF